MVTPTPVSAGFSPHDHQGCMSQALAAAEAHCAEQGLRLTPSRRRVLEILLESHQAMGAYEILDRLKADGQAAQPPVAYRALDFLLAQGFVHRIERLNAFTACSHPGAHHSPAFLVCRSCRAVAETSEPIAEDTLDAITTSTGFKPEVAVVEIEGLCPDCVDNPQ